MFLDTHVTGLRATFLHPGNSRVPLFHALCEDKRASKENGSAGDVRELGGYLAKGTDSATGQDVASAMSKC